MKQNVLLSSDVPRGRRGDTIYFSCTSFFEQNLSYGTLIDFEVGLLESAPSAATCSHALDLKSASFGRVMSYLKDSVYRYPAWRSVLELEFTGT